MKSGSDHEIEQQDESEAFALDAFELLYILVSHWRWLVFAPLCVGLAGLGAAYLITPTYTARTSFITPQQNNSTTSVLQSLGSLGGLASGVTNLKNPSDQYVALLRSRTVQQALVQRFKLNERYQADVLEDAVAILDANVMIAAGKDGLIHVSISDKDATFAAQLANSYIDELGTLVGRLTLTEAQQRRVFFEKQLEQAKVNMTKAEQALKGTGINVLTLKSSPASAVSMVAQLQAQITSQKVFLEGLRRYATESSPEVKAATTALGALQHQLEQASRNEVAPKPSGSDYLARYRDFKYHETLFDMLARQYELAKVDEARDGPIIQVIDKATPPAYKSKPRKGNIAIACTLAAFFIVLSAVLLREASRQWMKNPQVAEKVRRLYHAWH